MQEIGNARVLSEYRAWELARRQHGVVTRKQCAAGRAALPPHPSAQARDRVRDQAHTAAGLTQLRFTHHQVKYEPRHQVKYEPRYVRAILTRTATRLAS